MININSLPEHEMKMYKSAYDYFDGSMKRNSDNTEKAVQKILKKTLAIFSDNVSSPDKLKKYLNQEISMVRELPDPILITDTEVRDSNWWNELRQTNIRFEHWDRYEKYLEENKSWPRSAVEKSINYTTDWVMNAIANPNERKAVERKGMVLGYVQSGKTAHYIGLINKAVDAGYKVIIILAGIHNNLRSQTQARIDEEVLGYETSAEYIENKMKGKLNVIGVGKWTVKKEVMTNTTRDEKGDFSEKKASLNLEIPTVFVVKKNYKVLENLIGYIENNHKRSIDKETEKSYISCKYPVLLIDDEADQASVNIKYDYEDGVIKDEEELSRINGLIRDLFHIFECRSYIGYTATPYANIFIPSTVESKEHGKDLFPSHFILTLPKPSKYIGAQEFFGDEDNGVIQMPLRRKITKKSVAFVNNKEKKVTEQFPKELKKAIQSFIISVAIRIQRGQSEKPNSMLIHVTRLTDVQKLVHRKVQQYYNTLSEMLIDGDPEVIEEIKQLWTDDYVKTTQTMKKHHAKYMDDCYEVEWNDVYKTVIHIIKNEEIRIYSINGKSKDALLYKENKGKPYNVIVIGGDKLSRGLTLEGLTVSYFTRESKMYDTLMQMGRWFGFRDGYVDLCRLYVTDDLFTWFKHISFATEDLRDQIQYMNEDEETPENFGLRVATHPKLKISSPKKVQSGEERCITFSNVFSQTRVIDVDAEKYDRNFHAVEELLSLCGKPKKAEEYWKEMNRTDNSSRHIFWTGVDGHIIADFMGKYETSSRANKANSMYMEKYIIDQMKVGGLLEWTVCLVNIGDETRELNIGGYDISSGMKRKDIDLVPGEKCCSIKTLTPEDFQFLDFTDHDMAVMKQIREKFENQNKRVSNDYIREKIRSRNKGLLVICPLDIKRGNGYRLVDHSVEHHSVPIGIAVVFPHNQHKGNLIPYRVNEVGLKGEYNELFE
mgnify:CR=1 FL=1